MPAPPFLSAALAGVPTGVQTQGIWTGRRQLFVRFAGEAETATLYSAVALGREINRVLSRTTVHSIAIVGPDALGSLDFLKGAFEHVTSPLPVMVDTDGQRPDAVLAFRPPLTLVQVTVCGSEPPAFVDRALQTIRTAAGAGCEHALVLTPREDTSDAQLLRVIEQAHGASAGTMLVVHPHAVGERSPLERRWLALMEQATALHGDVRLLLRLPPGGGR